MNNSTRGVTLIEMLVVMTLIGILTGLSFPAINSGIDSLRLSAASDSIVAFLNSGLNRAERRQEGVELTVSKPERTLSLQSTDPTFSRTLQLPEGVQILRVLPEVPTLEPDAPRRFLLLPAATLPRIGLEIQNRRGVRRLVQVDPLTGVPQVQAPVEAEP